ncbi:hypothetical protein CLV30_101124 [Haloactinopolyspora alba]|uniref:Uncharacterized protein n=1 Tax=Haloactinopolyspora alba TaxID=648780 RepID=A0A2P8EFA6_9ACTN|nr:hypothetical protein [Haloactinopolyspora alba]PSL08157.1 hypothetical protein CLV30_101124 [Haloactinopolyspora alba]
MSTKILTRQICLSCQRRTPHEELRRDDGTHVPGKTILVCETCGIVTTAPKR